MTDECEFVIEREGKILKCASKSCGGIARGSDLCTTHFNLVVRDNKARTKLGMPIPWTLSDTVIRISKTEKNKCTKELDSFPVKDRPKLEEVDQVIECDIVNGEGF